MYNYETIKYRKFRILFEDSKARGFIGWTIVRDCKTKQEAIDFFKQQFSANEVISVTEVI